MYATERQEAIEALLRQEGRVGVVELASRFDVTTETVRRDLDRMEGEGLLRRVHGGAVANERTSTAERSVAERLLRRGEEKRVIATRALEALGPSFRGSIFLDAGSTTAAIAAALPAHLRATGADAEVVTHSMTLAHALAGDDVPLSVIGGRVRGVTAAAVGAQTVRAIEGMRPDVAFVGTNGVSASFGLSTPDPDEAAVKSAIVHAAQRVIVVADADKFGAELLVRFAGLDDVDVLVSDAAAPDALRRALSEAGTEMWLA